MDFDALLLRYFGTTDPTTVSPDALAGALDRMRVDFGMERERCRRFALWALMHMLGDAPDLDIAFKDAADRDAARHFMDIADRAGD